MLNPVFTGPFKKDYKLLKKRNKNLDILIEVMNILVNEQPLLQKYENYPLQGNFKGKLECHIEPDWLLVYRVEKTSNQVIFYRTGSHSDIF